MNQLKQQQKVTEAPMGAAQKEEKSVGALIGSIIVIAIIIIGGIYFFIARSVEMETPIPATEQPPALSNLN